MNTYGMPAQSSCGCGQTGSFDANYPGTSTPYMDNSGGGAPVPSLRNAPIPPASQTAPTPSSSTSIPAIPGSDSTMMFNRGQMQNVSYEEFQRLPGTVISGPGAVTPASNSFVAPPSPGITGAAAANNQGWVPAPSN